MTTAQRFFIILAVLVAVTWGIAATQQGTDSVSATQGTYTTTERDPALWAPPDEPEGSEPGPVLPLGYHSEAEAAQHCTADQTVITLYRQRQIVGYGCAR